MTHRHKTRASMLASIFAILLSATSIPAADFTLAWDNNSNDYSNLTGYYIYFKADSSVQADPDGAELIYVALTDEGFDPDQPSYKITDLLDDIRYFFTVTAMYNDEESPMSNEVSAIKYSSSQNSGIGSTTDTTSADAGSSGCFISALK